MSGFPTPGAATFPSPPTDTETRVTFGDKRPAVPSEPLPDGQVWPGRDWPPLPGNQMLRKLNPGCSFPEIQTYRQTNGPLYLTRFCYNKLWVTGVGQSEAHAVYLAQQFYMNETQLGRENSVKVVGSADG